MKAGFDYKDQELYPIEEPYISDCGKYCITRAQSIDKNDVAWDYEMRWAVKDCYLGDPCDADGDFEFDLCDWDSFEVIQHGQSCA